MSTMLHTNKGSAQWSQHDASTIHRVVPVPRPRTARTSSWPSVLLALLLGVSLGASAYAQGDSSHASDNVTIQGTVFDSAHKSVSGASVRLEGVGAPDLRDAQSNAEGGFAFSSLKTGSYHFSAEKSGLHSNNVTVTASSPNEQKHIEIVLMGTLGTQSSEGSATASQEQAIEFADKPNFTVAGVTDWTAVGGHGSDTSLRASESLARETMVLKPQGSDHSAESTSASRSDELKQESTLKATLASQPADASANRELGLLYLRAGHYRESIPLLQKVLQVNPSDDAAKLSLAQAAEGAGDLSQAQQLIDALLTEHPSGDVHRLTGELAERRGDPLHAVQEFATAARLDPSEQNYFEWGSELLLHRAVWQAQEVFTKGNAAYPKSTRMLTALGASLFAGALYDKSAQRLCEASDLAPRDPEPYMFMGKIEMVAPNPLGCIEDRLARFAQLQPNNALANYFYAMSLLKRQSHPADTALQKQAEMLLARAVAVDNKCSDAYLQLGVLAASQHQLPRAVDFFHKAIDANPELGEAHYRLGVAYDRLGQPAMAQQEFALHDQLEKQQEDNVEAQRREVKQFLVVLGDHSNVQPRSNP